MTTMTGTMQQVKSPSNFSSWFGTMEGRGVNSFRVDGVNKKTTHSVKETVRNFKKVEWVEGNKKVKKAESLSENVFRTTLRLSFIKYGSACLK